MADPITTPDGKFVWTGEGLGSSTVEFRTHMASRRPHHSRPIKRPNPVTEDSAEETQRLLKTLVEFTEATSEHVPNLGRAEWVRLRGLLAIPALFMLITGLAFTMSTVHYDKQVEIIESGLGVSIPTNQHSPVNALWYSRDLCDPENRYYGQSDGILAPTPVDGRLMGAEAFCIGQVEVGYHGQHGVMGPTIHFSDHGMVRRDPHRRSGQRILRVLRGPTPPCLDALPARAGLRPLCCIPYVFYRYARQSNVRGQEAKEVLEAKGFDPRIFPKDSWVQRIPARLWDLKRCSIRLEGRMPRPC